MNDSWSNIIEDDSSSGHSKQELRSCLLGLQESARGIIDFKTCLTKEKLDLLSFCGMTHSNLKEEIDYSKKPKVSLISKEIDIKNILNG